MATATKSPLYDRMDGIIYPTMFAPKCFREALDYEAQPNDIFLVTYPKCGTTWMQHILMYIFRKGKELESMSDFIKYCPFIDMCGSESIEKMKRPGCIKTHLPYSHLPLCSQAKYIFIARNPKDCCVSFYHHARSHPGFGYCDGDFNHFFELFMNGELEYNDYFDHLLSWYPHRNDANVFYTTYEEMKNDIKNVVVSVSKFLGKEYIEEIEKDNSVLNNIVLYSSFDYMKKHYSRPSCCDKNKLGPETYYGIKYIYDFVASLDFQGEITKGNNIRKGIVGDWKNVLSSEQDQRLTDKFFERTKDTDIKNWFPEQFYRK